MSCVGDRWEAGSSVLVKRLDENVNTPRVMVDE